MMKSERGQAIPKETVLIDKSAFKDNGNTAIYWLGEAGVMVNSRGTVIFIDPILSVMPASILPGKGWMSEVNGTRCLRVPPVQAHQVDRLDAVLYTHSDDDHLGVITAPMLRPTLCSYHTTAYAAKVLKDLNIPEERIAAHPREDHFQIGCITVEMTPANHPWQKSSEDVYGGWHFSMDDCCGFRLITPDGTIWIPGDSLPMDEHLQYDCADVIFADFSDDPFHYGSESMLRLCNHYRDAELIAYHWGTLDLPDFLPQNANPYRFAEKLENPDRLHILAPGEPYILKK